MEKASDGATCGVAQSPLLVWTKNGRTCGVGGKLWVVCVMKHTYGVSDGRQLGSGILWGE